MLISINISFRSFVGIIFLIIIASCNNSKWYIYSDKNTGPYTLEIITQNGTVLKDPDLDEYSYGDTVTLQSVPDSGYAFYEWRGDVNSSQDTLTMIMDSNKTIEANFVLIGDEIVYYVDYENGSDSNDGTNPTSAWKHAPGDINAIDNPAADNLLKPGDTVLFRAGVEYKGQITINADGASGYPITYKGTGWGTGKAILDGSVPLIGWTACSSQTECGGNPNWANIYYTYAPADSTPFTANLHEGEDFLWLAQEPDQPDPYFSDEIDYFYEIPCSQMTSTSIVDSNVFNQASSTYWDGSYVLVWRYQNGVDLREITSYTPSQNRITFDTLEQPPYTDRNEKYSIINSLHALDQAGEYYFDPNQQTDGTHKVYLWPRNVSNLNNNITISVLNNGIDINERNNIVIDGFRAQKYSGEGLRDGVAIGKVTATSVDSYNIVIRNNDVYHNRHSTPGGNGVILLMQCNNSLVENNTVVENAFMRGIFALRSNKVAFINNTVRKPGSTGISFYTCTNSEIVNNRIEEAGGSHANGMSVYLYCENISVRQNIIIGCSSPMTFQNITNVDYINNVVYGTGTYAISEWPGYTRGTVNVLHNTFMSAGNGAINACRYTTATYNISNNIIQGLINVGYESSTLINTYNIYTGLSYQQDSTQYGWVYGEGEQVVTDLSTLFVDADNHDYELCTGSPAIDNGTNAGVFVDFYDELRPQGSGYDIGAYEY